MKEKERPGGKRSGKRKKEMVEAELLGCKQFVVHIHIDIIQKCL